MTGLGLGVRVDVMGVWKGAWKVSRRLDRWDRAGVAGCEGAGWLIFEDVL